jgi:hypothetical protein
MRLQEKHNQPAIENGLIMEWPKKALMNRACPTSFFWQLKPSE